MTSPFQVFMQTVWFLCHRDENTSLCSLVKENQNPTTAASTHIMFSVTLMLLLLAAGSYKCFHICHSQQFFVCCLFTGVKCEQLTQPASVTVQPGQRLTITCQVSYSLSSYYTAWIRQPAGKGLEWFSSDTAVKDSLKNKFSVTLDSSSKTFTLNGQNMQPEDTAVYYCARQPQ